MNFIKETVGFEIPTNCRQNGHVKKNEVKSAISGFLDETKDQKNIKLLAFIFMGHGSENDW